jgi:ribosomal protein L21E
MADTTIDFGKGVADEITRDLLYHIALTSDPRVWRAIEAFQRGEFVTVTVDGEAKAGYPSPLQSTTLER